MKKTRWIKILAAAGCAAACIASAVMLIHMMPKRDYTYTPGSAQTPEVTQASLTTEDTDASAERTAESWAHTEPAKTESAANSDEAPANTTALQTEQTAAAGSQTESAKTTLTTARTTAVTTAKTRQTVQTEQTSKTETTAPESRRVSIRKIEKPACLDWHDGEYYIVSYPKTDELHAGDMLCWRDGGYLYPVYQTVPGGAWGYYYFDDNLAEGNPDMTLNELKTWVETNLPGWFAAGNFTIYPQTEGHRASVADWMDACNRLYEAFGYKLTGDPDRQIMMLKQWKVGIPFESEETFDIPDSILSHLISGGQPKKSDARWKSIEPVYALGKDVSAYQMGDVNMDGTVNLLDARMVADQFNFWIIDEDFNMTDDQLYLADVCKSKVWLNLVDSIDASNITTYVCYNEYLKVPKTMEEVVYEREHGILPEMDAETEAGWNEYQKQFWANHQ